jgi:DNA-binding CsgD family transcriptional regulator
MLHREAKSAKWAARTARKPLILSPREKRFLRRLARGQTDKEIAVAMGGSERQIAQRRQRLLKRLSIQSREQIVNAANELASWPKRR